MLMGRFIMVHKAGERIMVNLNWVQEIRENKDDGSCTIYYAFNLPEAIDQDYLKPDESFDEVVGKAWWYNNG